MQQTGGVNTTTFVSIGAGGQYQFSGGTLQASGGIANQGVFDAGNQPVSINAGGIVDLSSGTWKGLGDASLSMGANSLLIVPAGFNPATALANYSSLGLVHTAGTTLTLSAGQGFSGIGSIGDPVVCQGTITAQSGYFVNLNNGLVLSAGGNASLGSGSLTANDAVSGISGGSLSAGNEYFGKGGTAVFTQSAGNNSDGQPLPGLQRRRPWRL